VPVLQLGHSSGILDQVWSTRLGRGDAEGMRLIASVEKEVQQALFIAPMLEAGADQQTARERAAQLSADLNTPALIDRALLAAYRRQQELAWTESLVEDIEDALEETGGLGRPERVPAICFLDLVGYTRLTEEHGDQAAAELAEALAVLVDRSSREHGGVPVKWLGDGVMVHFRDPAGAVLAALRLVEELPGAGLPPAHVGVAAGPVVVQGGDYLRTPLTRMSSLPAPTLCAPVSTRPCPTRNPEPTVHRGPLPGPGRAGPRRYDQPGPVRPPQPSVPTATASHPSRGTHAPAPPPHQRAAPG
jgi:class 3 adenylate cyclase